MTNTNLDDFISTLDLKSLRELQIAIHNRYGELLEAARKTLIKTIEREAATLGFESIQELIAGFPKPPTLRRARKANGTKHRKNGPEPSGSSAEHVDADIT